MDGDFSTPSDRVDRHFAGLYAEGKLGPAVILPYPRTTPTTSSLTAQQQAIADRVRAKWATTPATDAEIAEAKQRVEDALQRENAMYMLDAMVARVGATVIEQTLKVAAKFGSVQVQAWLLLIKHKRGE
jgi:hypothetical protein